jgi:hypothetical protein
LYICPAASTFTTLDPLVPNGKVAMVAPQVVPLSSQMTTDGVRFASKVPLYDGCGTMGGRK